MFIDSATLTKSLRALYGSAGHLLKIWFVLKQMGFEGDSSVSIDTSNSADALKRLFSFGSPDGKLYVPFAHTPRYLTMQHDAARSIVQTTIQRWASSGSVVTCDPTEFLSIEKNELGKLIVSPSRRYPFGLGIGESGFALSENDRVSVPLRSFAAWYGRKSAIPDDADPAAFLVDQMLVGLNISASERDLVFIDDNLEFSTQDVALTDAEIFAACEPFINGQREPEIAILQETFPAYTRRIKSMVSALELPAWMRTSPEEDLQSLVNAHASAILLYGPPRTGKTRIIDHIVSRTDERRCTIQLHDGWGYDELIQGLRPTPDGKWVWQSGPLKNAIEDGKKFIVLEEINRTSLSQALGEVFSLIEDDYRGEQNSITLRDGNSFFIPEDVTFLMTMNTVDKSTEEVDDALMGRLSSVQFPPRVEDLRDMLSGNNVPSDIRDRLAEVFTEIQSVYPLGHGYFSGLDDQTSNDTVVRYYKARVRPVLNNFFGSLKAQELARIDNIIDELFGNNG